tara:strand:+ start:162 stop:479 length:318 start_codon:yes stop_codon:yes gene_type:complete
MIKLDDKNYTRNLHYHFKTDENHYERIDVEDKEHLLFKMIEHWERMLMLYKKQSIEITSLEQLVDDKHIENGVDRSHKYYKEITQCIEFLHQLNSWYEDMKGYDE